MGAAVTVGIDVRRCCMRRATTVLHCRSCPCHDAQHQMLQHAVARWTRLPLVPHGHPPAQHCTK